MFASLFLAVSLRQHFVRAITKFVWSRYITERTPHVFIPFLLHDVNLSTDSMCACRKRREKCVHKFLLRREKNVRALEFAEIFILGSSDAFGRLPTMWLHNIHTGRNSTANKNNIMRGRSPDQGELNYINWFTSRLKAATKDFCATTSFALHFLPFPDDISILFALCSASEINYARQNDCEECDQRH